MVEKNLFLIFEQINNCKNFNSPEETGRSPLKGQVQTKVIQEEICLLVS
jgi:hypothetical protein